MMLRQLLLMPSMSVLFILMGRVHVDVKQTSVLRIALLWTRWWSSGQLACLLSDDTSSSPSEVYYFSVYYI